MMSSITPVGENARGQRWSITATAHVLGASLGGVALGLMSGTLGSYLRFLGAEGWLGEPVPLMVLAVAAGVGAVLERGSLARPVPSLHRQVDERWLDTYRGWVYGGGFGAQLGFGLVTIIPTWATPVMIIAMVLVGSPMGGAVIGVVYGLGRGLPVLMTRRLTEPARLWRFHAGLEKLRPVGVHLAVGGLAAVALAGAVLAERVGA